MIQQLRTGNLMRDALTKTLLRVDSIDVDKGIELYVLDRSKFPLPKGWQYESIKLTDDILWQLELGYTSLNKQFNFSGVNGVEYVIEKQSDWYFMGIKNGSQTVYFAWNIYTLHQLQNLYFELTGQELNTAGLI